MVEKKIFEVKCTDCGETATVTFEPTKGKPVYCKTCFLQQRQKRRSVSNMKRNFNMKNAWAIRGDQWRGKRREQPQRIFQTW